MSDRMDGLFWTGCCDLRLRELEGAGEGDGVGSTVERPFTPDCVRLLGRAAAPAGRPEGFIAEGELLSGAGAEEL